MKIKLFIFCALLVASLLYATTCNNVVIHLTATDGTFHMNWVSLPYTFDAPDTAQTVCADIGATASQVGKYDESTDNFTSWGCGGRGTPFTLHAGVGYYIKVSTNTDWTPSK